MVNEKERYSFSKLSLWHTCPYAYYQKYVEKSEGATNAFASYGTLVHSIMERYAKGEAEVWDLPGIYEWEFESAIPERFPYNKYADLRASYYTSGLEFLNNFQGYDKYKILGVEEKFEIDLGGWILNGIVDLIYQDEDGRLIIRDYKSKSSFKNKKEQKEYARQLYLYSAYVNQKYGRYPDELQFLMFRKQQIVSITFDQEAFKEAFDWAEDTVKNIREAFDYPPTCDDYYSRHLCDSREICEFNISRE